MIIIINYDKQVTMFFNINFMDAYGMEHLPKMNHHTMHSPQTLQKKKGKKLPIPIFCLIF
jgi:hypothetical protein